RTKKVQEEEIADRVWNGQAKGERVRVRKFCSSFFSSFECAHDRCAPGGLHREHARSLFPDPAESFHFVERFPHADQTGAAAGGIKNDIRQLPLALSRQFVPKRLFTLDPIRLLER